MHRSILSSVNTIITAPVRPVRPVRCFVTPVNEVSFHFAEFQLAEFQFAEFQLPVGSGLAIYG